MKTLNVFLTQQNAKQIECFRAEKFGFQIENIDELSEDIARFSIDTINTMDKLKGLGINANNFKAAYPLYVQIESFEDDVKSMNFKIKNFGKWLRDNEDEKIKEAFQTIIEYLDRNSWSNTL